METGKTRGSGMIDWLMGRARRMNWFTRIVCVLGILCTPFEMLAQSSSAIPISGGPVVTPYNTPAVNAPVRVCLITSFGSPCSTAGVILYSDDNLTQKIGNPTATSSQGVYNFFINSSQYSLPQLFIVQVSVTPT